AAGHHDGRARYQRLFVLAQAGKLAGHDHAFSVRRASVRFGVIQDAVVQAQPHRLARAAQRWKVANALEGVGRDLYPGVAALEDGHGLARLLMQQFSALRADRSLDAVCAALTRMARLVLAELVRKVAFPAVEGDEDAEVLSLGHRR